jgi:membrane protein implicated in regulation of membrane protease activity
MLASGWVWLIGAIVLAIAETLLPGFILLGFSLGAIVTGLLLSGLAWTLLVFALASGIGWLVLRKVFMRPDQRPKIWKRDINDN